MEITTNTTDTEITYTMIDDGVEVGELIAHTTGLILNIEVDQDRRGEGIARHLFEYADAEQGLYHIPSWGRTEDGDGFAEAMGGDTMDDAQAAAIVGFDLTDYQDMLSAYAEAA